MDRIVNRETVAMHNFVSAANTFADQMDRVLDRLNLDTDSAYGYMQDESGHNALQVLRTFHDDAKQIVERARYLAEQIQRSAKALEESDALL